MPLRRELLLRVKEDEKTSEPRKDNNEQNSGRKKIAINVASKIYIIDERKTRNRKRAVSLVLRLNSYSRVNCRENSYRKVTEMQYHSDGKLNELRPFLGFCPQYGDK